MPVPRSFRLIALAVFLVCAGLLSFSILYLQGVLDLEPCPMCILQRIAFMGAGGISLIAAIHGPGEIGRRIYGALIALASLAGAGVALRHSWLQWFPADTSRCAGSDLEYMVNTFPLAEALPKIFAGSGECAEVKWTFLHLSIPEWAIVWFAALVALGCAALFRPRWFAR